MKFEDDLHDWYIEGVILELSQMEIYVHFYGVRRTIKMSGVSRCLINYFLIKNIIYEAKILSSPDDNLFKKETERLHERYPFTPKEPHKILPITPSVGADITVEFTELSIHETE